MEKIVAKKSLGQNFLTDKKVVEDILKNIIIDSKDLIIEIGPGTGFLTEELKKFNSFLLCYEIDESLKESLEKYCDEKTVIKYENFLNADINADISQFDYANVLLVANIPYYITTPILKKIIDSKINFKGIILMVQKEFGEKLCAEAGDTNYSSLTVFINYYFEVKRLFLVDKNSFFPTPKVDSMIIKLNKINRKIVPKDYSFFEKLIKESFQFRRKTLQNNLKKYNLTLVKEFLEKSNRNLSIRPQNISVEDYIEIANILLKK